MSKAAELAALIGSQSALSNRNLIINGSQIVAQRGTSGTSGNGYNSVDRFRMASGSTDEWALTQTQETDAPTGFSKSTKYTCTTAETALASDEWAAIQYTFEGQDLQHLSYGSASAQSVTLSFWVKSSATGTFGVSIFQPNDSRIIGSTYTISSANTWEQKIITFAGDTTGIIDNVNTEGLRIYWFLAAGSSFTSTDNTSWKAYAGTDFAYGHAVNLIDSTSDNLYLTGVQLEVGEQATPFEHRSYGDELSRCQRYYYAIDQNAVGSIYTSFVGTGYSSTQCNFQVSLPVQMRVPPTMTYNSGSGFYRFYRNNTYDAFDVLQNDSISPLHVNIASNGGVSHSAGDCGTVQVRVGDGAGFQANAEL